MICGVPVDGDTGIVPDDPLAVPLVPDPPEFISPVDPVVPEPLLDWFG
jgi:hypothetical protein